MPGAARLYGFPATGVEVLLPELLHRRPALGPHVRGVIGRVPDAADDERALAVDVEDVDAGRRLLERAEKDSLAGEGAAEDGAVDGTVQDEEHDVPACVREQCVQLGDHAVEQLADRLAAEEPRVERDDAAEGGRHHLLHRLWSDAAELAALDLPQLGFLLQHRVGRDHAGRLERAWQAARDHAVEVHLA